MEAEGLGGFVRVDQIPDATTEHVVTVESALGGLVYVVHSSCCGCLFLFL